MLRSIFLWIKVIPTITYLFSTINFLPILIIIFSIPVSFTEPQILSNSRSIRNTKTFKSRLCLQKFIRISTVADERMLYDQSRYSGFLTVNLHTKIIRNTSIRICFADRSVFTVNGSSCKPQAHKLIQNRFSQLATVLSDFCLPAFIWDDDLCSIRTGGSGSIQMKTDKYLSPRGCGCLHSLRDAPHSPDTMRALRAGSGHIYSDSRILLQFFFAIIGDLQS